MHDHLEWRRTTIWSSLILLSAGLRLRPVHTALTVNAQEGLVHGLRHIEQAKL